MDSPTFVPMVHIGKAKVAPTAFNMSERARFTSFHRLNSRISHRKQPTIDWFITSKRYYQSPRSVTRLFWRQVLILRLFLLRKERDEHMKKVEKEIWNTYKPRMKKLTFTQGKLLIKLIDRECNSTSYDWYRHSSVLCEQVSIKPLLGLSVVV